MVSCGKPLPREYALADHQGNIRSTFGMLHDTDVYYATMETERATEEQADFLNMTTNFVGLYNHTEATIELPNPDRSKYIAPGSSGDIGPALAIPVNSGDKISAEIFALFDNSSSSNNTSAPSGILEAVASTFGTTSGEALYGQFSNAISSLVSGWSNASSVTPDAYLNLVWVNTTNTTSSFAYDKVEPTAYTNYEPLNVEFTAPGAGTVFIYVANESDQSSTDLFLDDFLVVHEKTTSSLNIVSTANYYPFGMKMDAESYDHLSREKQRYGYNGNEEIGGGGLTLMDFNARIYNPSLGRFMGADALASVSAASSPYAFTSNDPINLIDPTGLTEREWGGSFRKHFLANFGYEGSFARDKRIWGAGRTGPGSSYHWSDQYSNRSGLNANFPFINWAISTGNFDKLPQGHYSNDGRGSFSFSHITGAYWRDYDNTYTTGNFYDGDLTVHGRRSELIIETNTSSGGSSSDPPFGHELSDWVDVAAAELMIFGTGFDLSSWEKPKNMHWDDFKAGQKVAKGVARRLSVAGAVISVSQAIYNPTGGNMVDAVFGVIGAIPGPGTAIGGVYFATDLLTMGITGKGISDHIDNYIWMPNPAGIGFIPVTKIPGK